MTSLTRSIFFMSFLASLLAGCATTQKSESVDLPVIQPNSYASGTVRAAPSPQVQPTYEAVVVEAPDAAVEVEEGTIAEPAVVELAPKPMPAPEPEPVTRLEPNLPKGAMDTLTEADQLLELSDEQYNDFAQLLEERTAEWKALLADKKSLSDADFEARKSVIFGGYAKRMLAIFTPEQRKIWRQR